MAESENMVALTMNGGSGIHSYSKNSNFQRNFIDAAKELTRKGIYEKLDIKSHESSNTFRIADLGCATGPNTFLAVQAIIDAVALKLKSREKSSSALPEFQVFFNDQASNDFNELFATLPQGRQYFAAGVAGSFHDRLFPSSSIHFVHCSSAIHILSRVPKAVLDRDSPARNEGKVHLSNSGPEVVKAYEDQFTEDLKSFLEAREEEISIGGLMVLLVPGRANGIPHNEAFNNRVLELLGSCLMDMANKGKIRSEKVESFNFPMYFASAEEVEKIVKRNGSFGIEIVETLIQKNTPKEFSSILRAILEGFLKNRFGYGVLDELFDLLPKKFEEYSVCDSQANTHFILLKRI